ncbi:MAG TPA: hypothetical protein VK580_16575 [Steroidobacteraceae bacterium]|nr:hypothetical protein [Steroidobacteraceae bacterium]
MSLRAAGVRQILVAAAPLMLAACAASQPKPAAPVEPSPAPLDASYDWHVLLVAPFGSVLREVPLTMHEVLLFRDEAGRAAPDELECYAVDGARPRFVARSPSEYLLCFKHDRLSRIEATVQLPAEEAVRIYADACGLWLKKPVGLGEECAGTDGGVTFAGHFENEPDESAQLTIQLDAADPAAER